jgi:hypothetical protein
MIVYNDYLLSNQGIDNQIRPNFFKMITDPMMQIMIIKNFLKKYTANLLPKMMMNTRSPISKN